MALVEFGDKDLYRDIVMCRANVHSSAQHKRGVLKNGRDLEDEGDENVKQNAYADDPPQHKVEACPLSARGSYELIT